LRWLARDLAGRGEGGLFPEERALDMNNFGQILAAFGPPPGGPWNIGIDPPLVVTYNPASHVLVASLNQGVHLTIDRSAWDGVASIHSRAGHPVDVGPLCLHANAAGERWFRQFVQGSWTWVTDGGTPSRRYLLAFNAMMNTLTPYLGDGARLAHRDRRRKPCGPPAGNRIEVGAITSTNPSLWVNLLTLGQPATEYVVATSSPGIDFLYVNQFCSILSVKWLLGERGTEPFGIDQFTDAEKKRMAEILIGHTGMDDQIAHAEVQLGGVRRSLDEVALGVEDGAYKVGTPIWAGNDFHVVAITIGNEREYLLHDSNTGRATPMPRSRFRSAMDKLRCDAFVVA
jgi:hypothetical protein